MAKNIKAPSIGVRDTQTDMLPGGPKSAICVQKFDDSLISAIHITYRSWLRSSSMHEPRDPPLKVVYQFI
jgi:DNA gyrase inhibitor GyrI